MSENLEIFNFQLDDSEMASLDALDRNHRFNCIGEPFVWDTPIFEWVHRLMDSQETHLIMEQYATIKIGMDWLHILCVFLHKSLQSTKCLSLEVPGMEL